MRGPCVPEHARHAVQIPTMITVENAVLRHQLAIYQGMSSDRAFDPQTASFGTRCHVVGQGGGKCWSSFGLRR